jgi:hypothetical protein
MIRLVCSIAVWAIAGLAYADAPPNYQDEIRRLLESVNETSNLPIPDEIRKSIARHQPEAGNALLSILAMPNDRLYRQALMTFVSTWDVATADQIERYIQLAVTRKTNHRARFPAKSQATIAFETRVKDGRIGWPCSSRDKEFYFRAQTTRYLDGKTYEKLPEKLYDDRYPFGKIGCYNVGELAEGKHTIRGVMKYEFTHRGEKRTGEIQFKESSFEIVAADAADDPAVAVDDELRKSVRRSLVIREPEPIPEPRQPRFDAQRVDRTPLVWLEAAPTKWIALNCAAWEVRYPLDVDLCFDIEIHDIRSGKTYRAGEVRLVRGKTGRGGIVPADVAAFTTGRQEFVDVRVVMKPSRNAALADPQVRGYYPESISSAEMQMKIGPPRPLVSDK